MIVRYLIVFSVLVFGVKTGTDYLTSPEFQKYGDDKKAKWTCYVNNFLAEFNIVMSDYDRAHYYYRHIINRCPETGLSKKSEFKIAYCYQKKQQFDKAITHYQDFYNKYPEHSLSKKIPRRIQRIDESR